MKKFVCIALFWGLTSCTHMEKDSFIWLEKVEDTKSLDWVKEQNKDSLKTFGRAAEFSKLQDQAIQILEAKDKIPYGTVRGGYVYNFWQDGKNVRGLWRRASLSEYRKSRTKWTTILDFDRLAKKENENWVFKGAYCLPPLYHRCILRLSRGGKDAVVIREFNIEKRAFVKENPFTLKEGKSYTSWYDENHLLVGTNFGEGSLTTSGYPRIIKLWKRGQPLEKAKTLFEGEKKDVSVWAFVSHRPEGKYTFISRSLTFYKSENWLFSKDLRSKKILPMPVDAEFESVYDHQAVVLLRSPWKPKGSEKTFAQGSLINFDLREIEKKDITYTEILNPDQKSAVTSVKTTSNALLISVLSNVKDQVYEYKRSGSNWKKKRLKLPTNGSISIISSNEFSQNYMLSYEGFLTPTSLYWAKSQRRFLRKIKSLPHRFRSRGMEVHQYEVKSKDGELIPYFVIHKKGIKLNGKNPTLLYGYGGFEISLKPRYRGVTGKLWLEQGGVFVLANIRGGGEFGPRWHQAALKTNRQKAFDDFIGVAEDLIQRKITSPEHLGIQGGSNGGLLVGATFTQRPDLFKAVVCQVPLLDMLRYHKLLAGASWMGEYGNPDDSAMRKVLASYSPYHNVKKEARYPEVFFLTSTKDDRVHPGHARKMVAKMKSLGHHVYYYENTEGGHSASANLKQRAKMLALQFTYLTRMLQ